MEVKRIGNLSDTKTQSRTVYDSDGVSPTLCSGMDHGNTMPHIYEKTIVAMRGRNPENPSDRTVGAPTEQRLEPNSQGICNTITSVQKDNMVLETIALNPMEDGTCRTIKNQYFKNGTANFDNQGTWGATGVIETVRIKQATKEGYIECKVGGVADLSYPTSTTRRGRVQEGGDVCPTLTASESEICRIEKPIIYDDYNSRVRADQDAVGTITTNIGNDALRNGTKLIERYRIRKLTPMECWRLMDFSDQDFHRAEAVNSNTQLYKQAGNSIVRNVLVAIFGQMLPGKEDNYKKGA